MNDDLVFFKTFTGEDAVRDRTRLVQRNLRMVLILVDGLTNVASLKQKAGDSAMVETALAELERIGLISSGKPDDVKEKAAGAAPSDAETELPYDVAIYADTPTVDTVFEHLEPVVATTGPEIVVPALEALPTPVNVPKRDSSSDGWLARTRQRWIQMREERAYENAYGKASKIMVDASPAPDFAILSEPFKPRPKRSLRGVLAVTFVLLVVAGLVSILFYPYDKYRPAFEAHLSKLFANEVSVGSVKLSFTPLPVLLLERVVVGSDARTTIDEIALLPNVRSLLGNPSFREARVSGLHLHQAAIGRLSDWFSEESVKDLGIDRILIDNLTLEFGWTTLGGLSGTLKAGSPSGVVFEGRAAQGKLLVEAVSARDGLKISAKSSQWDVPIEPPLALGAIDFVGTLSSKRLLVEKVEAQAFDGIIAGTGRLDWEAAPGMALDLVLKHVSTARLLDAMQASPLLEGELAGQIQLTSDLPASRWLAQGAKVDGNVTVTKGRLKKLDFAGALRGSRGATRSGGDTGFEELSGRVSVDRSVVRVVGARLASGLMSAAGQTIISRETGGISGQVNVEMRSSASALRAQLAISGNSRDPELRNVR